jgi:hypothetical protein
MGEGKRRLDQIRAAQPFCIYCGGCTPIETIDHMPPITIFAQRRRPKGLEFGACYACNAGARLAEQVVGLLSRVWPDNTGQADAKEFRKILEAIKNNHPGLLEELMPLERQITDLNLHRAGGKIPEDVHAMNVSGPLVNAAVHCFAAKLGLAMHFHQTGHIVPFAGGVGIRWYTNYDAFTGKLPGELFRLLGPPQTLRQGRFHVADQFEVASATAHTSALSAHFATFRSSMAIAAFVAEDVTKLVKAPETHVYCPGWLKQPV